MATNGSDFVDIRLSDLLRDCTVGAIVRHGRKLMVVQDTRDWDGPNTHPYEREIQYVELVKRSLRLEGTKLCRPPVRSEMGGLIQGWVPARRFPEWMRCRTCGLLHNAPWRKDGRDEDVDAGVSEYRDAGPDGRARGHYRCTGPGAIRRSGGSGLDAAAQSCGGTLEQVPWVLVHEKGYLADVPWHALAHYGAAGASRQGCKPGWRAPYLRLEERVARRVVKCCREGCGAEGELRVPGRFPYGPFTRQQPWVPEPPPEPPDEPAWIVGVNDVRVHFAECRTALVIPPESRIRRGTVVDRLYMNSSDQDYVRNALNPGARDFRVRQLAGRYRCRPDEIESALQEIAGGYPRLDRELPRGDLLQLEYRALTEPIPDLREGEDFVTEHHTAGWHDLAAESDGLAGRLTSAIDRLVGAQRVKEIMVLDGFRRGWGSGEEARPPTPPDIAGESDWLPAIELWGEGLFFALNERLVSRWEQQDAVRQRAAEFVERSVEARLSPDVRDAISPRFLLCHTLSHLLIRRLEAEAGYPAASLKERLYCAGGDGDEAPMAGVLIYVAVTDDHGSLGGLMDMARPERFLRLLVGAVEDAARCSFDPVCVEREGHGPDLLNRAACHGCALLPEPACVCGNRLLDRAFLNGDGEGLMAPWELGAVR